MKSLLTLSFLLIIQLGSAQINEKAMSISVGEYNAFVQAHEGANRKMVEKAMDKIFKKYGKVKRNRKAKEWTCMNCNIPAVSSNPVNVYYKIDVEDKTVHSYLFVDDGSDFISSESHSAAAQTIKEIQTKAGFEVEKMVVTKELGNEEDTLKGFEKDLKKLEKRNNKLHENIEDYKNKILKAEAEIEQNLLDQESKISEIKSQRTTVESVSDKLKSIGKG